MASESGSVAQDEKTAVLEAESGQDAVQKQKGETAEKQHESKFTLYHWTQSFNSQKVSGSAPQLVDSSYSEKMDGMVWMEFLDSRKTHIICTWWLVIII